MISANSSTDFWPISRPISSEAISSTLTVLKGTSFENSFATTVSTGRTILPFAFFKSSDASSTLSSSHLDFPTFFPKAFKKVNIIPPPIINLSAFSSKADITSILSDTLEPPRMATYGLWGLSTAPPINLISFSSKKPAAVSLIWAAIPTFDAAALWAVPKASFTNTSPKDAQ